MTFDSDFVFQGRTESIYKVIVIGDPAVGKKSLLTKFVTKQFEERYLPTVGVNIVKESINIDDLNVTVNLMFWEVEGQPQFYMLHRPYFNGADGMILVFDITRSSTFSNINNWYSTTVKYGLSGIPRILIGNKIDLADDRKIILPMAEHLSEKLNAPYFETSAITGANVKLIFQTIAKLVYRYKEGDNWKGIIECKTHPNIRKEAIDDLMLQREELQIPQTTKSSTDSLIDPYLLWYLDQFGKLPPSLYLPTPKSNIPQTITSKEEKKKNPFGADWIRANIKRDTFDTFEAAVLRDHYLSEKKNQQSAIIKMDDGRIKARKYKPPPPPDDRDDRFPYPYIYNPPESPDDIKPAFQTQKIPIKEEHELKRNCPYCGNTLHKGHKHCPTCGKDVF